MFHGASQHDTLSDKDGQVFLQQRQQTWEQAQGASQFTTDLTDGLIFGVGPFPRA